MPQALRGREKPQCWCDLRQSVTPLTVSPVPQPRFATQPPPAFRDVSVYTRPMATFAHAHPAADSALTRAIGIVGVFVLFGPLIGAAMVSLFMAVGDVALAILGGRFRQAVLALPFTVISGTLVGLFVAYMAAGLHALLTGLVTAVGAAITGRPSPALAVAGSLAAFLFVGVRDWSAPVFQVGLAVVVVASALICCWIARKLLETLDAD